MSDPILNSVFFALRDVTVLHVAPLITASFITCLAFTMYGMFLSIYLCMSLLKISGCILLNLGTIFAMATEITFQLLCPTNEILTFVYCVGGVLLILLNWVEFGIYFCLRGLNISYRAKIKGHINSINSPPRRRVIRGMAVTVLGLAVILIGSLLSRRLLAIGNVLLLTGVAFTLKTERVLRHLLKAENTDACVGVTLGILLMIHEFSVIGMMIQMASVCFLFKRNIENAASGRNAEDEQPPQNFDIASLVANSQTAQRSKALAAVGLIAAALGLLFWAGTMFSLGMVSLLAAVVNFVGIRSFVNGKGLLALVASALGCAMFGPVIGALMLLSGAIGIAGYHAYRLRDLYNFQSDLRFQICLGMAAVVFANTLLGVLFLFNPVMQSIGQIALLVGLVYACGLVKFKSLVNEMANLEGHRIMCFGILMLIFGFPLLGIFVEGYGAFYMMSHCPIMVHVLTAVYPAFSELLSYVWRRTIQNDELPSIQDFQNDNFFGGLVHTLFESISVTPQIVDEPLNYDGNETNVQQSFTELVGNFLHRVYQSASELPNYMMSFSSRVVSYVQGVSQAVCDLCSCVGRLVTGDRQPSLKDLQNDEDLASRWQSLVQSVNGQTQDVNEEVRDLAPDVIPTAELYSCQPVRTGVELVALGLATVGLSWPLNILVIADSLFCLGCSIAIAGLINFVGVAPLLNIKGLVAILSPPLMMVIFSPVVGYSLLLLGAFVAVAKTHARHFSNFYNFTDDPKLQICLGMSGVVLFTAVPGLLFPWNHALLILIHMLLVAGFAVVAFDLNQFESFLNETEKGFQLTQFGILAVLFGFPRIGMCFEVLGIYFLTGTFPQVVRSVKDFCSNTWRLYSRVTRSDADMPRFPDMLKDVLATPVHLTWSITDSLMDGAQHPAILEDID